MSETAAVHFVSPRQIAEEDQARADFYALLANLFYRPPDQKLLSAMVVAAEPEGEGEGAAKLTTAWRELARASHLIPAEAVAEEFQQAFVGVGRAPVSLYGSSYIAGFMMERPLAELRADLACLGMARAPGATESEDHLAALCDVMRALICGDLGDRPATQEEQRRFFQRHLQPWVFQCCDAATKTAQLNYYSKVAEMARAFFEIEAAALNMAESSSYEA